MVRVLLMPVMLQAVVLIGARASVRTPGVKYRSIIGDPGMKWKGGSEAGGSLSQPGSGWLSGNRVARQLTGRPCIWSVQNHPWDPQHQLLRKLR